MRRERSCSGVVLLLACASLALASRPAVAQRVVLRFDPGAGMIMHTITDLHAFTTLVGFPAVPDSARFETVERQNATVRSEATSDGDWTVRVTVDSVKGQTRPVDGAWRVLTDTTMNGRTARATVDDRLHIVGIDSHGESDAAILRVIHGAMADLSFALPDQPVGAGDTVRTDARVLFTARTPPAAAVDAEATLRGELMLVVDSIATPAGDTLTYFRFRGAFTPATVQSQGESGNVSGEYAGAFAGRLIWSHAWSAFVSGVSRIRARARLHRESAAGAFDASETWDVTTTYQVRP